MKWRLFARTSSFVRGAVAAAGAWRGSFRSLLLLNRAPGPLDRLRQPALVHRLQQIVHGLQPEGLHRVLIVSRDEDEVRQVDVLLAQPADHAHAVQPGHMYVQKHQFRLQFLDQIDGFQAIGTGCNYFNFREIPQQVGELVAGQLFIVYDNCREGSRRAVSHGVGIIAFRL